jgi:protein-L-isoaspartate O-methyltransferase
MEPTNNERTVASYEDIADDYAEQTKGGHVLSGGLTQLALAAPGGAVLEIGSGPGWDADALETFGIDVHRTDAAIAFCEFQAGRGKRCDRLDVLSDTLECRYGGAMMLCVLQHFDRPQLDAALRSLAGALHAGGALLLMYPEGDGDLWEHGAAGDYRVVRWTAAALDAHLARAGFTVAWEDTRRGRGGTWRTVLARQRD